MHNPDRTLPLDKLPVAQRGDTFPFLKGVRVLDLTSSIAGPYATMLLSDFGAEVIKVEGPEGDDSRSWGPPFLNEESLWFLAMNRNKKSVVLDLSDDEDLTRLKQLLSTVDVVVTNQPLFVQKKRGLDYASVAAIRPDIVFVSITGFGLTGMRADQTCYDLIAEGHSGIMHLTGEADAPPQKVGAPAADMLAGQDAAMSVMAALFERQREGRGRLIDISLVESMTRFLACRVSAYLGSGEAPVRSGGTDSVIAIYQQFETADLPLTLAIGNQSIWKRFWSVMGDPGFAEQEKYGTNELRRAHRAEIVAKISGLLLTRRRDDWLEAFAAARVPSGPINSVEDLVTDPGMLERGMFFALENEGRLIPQVGLGIRIDGEVSHPRSAPPVLGQHTDEVLSLLRQNRRPGPKAVEGTY